MHAQRRRAITLIEVIVTCVALLLLVGQLAAAARQSSAEGRLALCTQRLGEVARACLAYAAQDPDERVLPVSTIDAVGTWAYTTYYGFGGKSGYGMDLTGSLSMSPYSGAGYMNSARRPLNNLISKDPLPAISDNGYSADWSEDARLKLDVYHCPADRGFPSGHIQGWKFRGGSSYGYFGTSYITNPLYMRRSNQMYSYGLRNRSASEIPSPADTIMVWENAGLFAFRTPNSELNQTGCFWGVMTFPLQANGWHGEPFHFNAAMADGSVRYIQLKGFGRPDNPLPPAQCPDGIPCDCYMVRGLNWRLDTLPAAPSAVDKFGTTAGAFLMGLGSGSEFSVVN